MNVKCRLPWSRLMRRGYHCKRYQLGLPLHFRLAFLLEIFIDKQCKAVGQSAVIFRLASGTVNNDVMQLTVWISPISPTPILPAPISPAKNKIVPFHLLSQE